MAAAAVISELPRWHIIVEAIAPVLWHLTPGRGHCAGAEITAKAPAAESSSAAWQAEPVVSGVSPILRWARRASPRRERLRYSDQQLILHRARLRWRTRRVNRTMRLSSSISTVG